MKYSTIKGSFSERRRIPLLGRIRLGLKVQKVRADKSVVEYPTETDYFVVPPEVAAIVGEKPTELTVMLPSDDVATVFPQNLAWFGRSTGLKCTGNMEEAERLDPQTGQWNKMQCPCPMLKTDENPKGECTESGTLVVILPEVSMGGTYQIRTGSYHSVVDINSGLDFVRALIGRISMVPLKLRRTARETHNDGKKQIHHTLSLTIDANIKGINALRGNTKQVLESARLIQIEGPVAVDPENDGLPPDRVEEAEVVDPNAGKLEAGKEALAAQRTGGAGPTTPAAPGAPAPAKTAPAAPPPVDNSTAGQDGGKSGGSEGGPDLRMVPDAQLRVPIGELQKNTDGEGILSKIERNFNLQPGTLPQDPEARSLYLEALWEGVGDLQKLKAAAQPKKGRS